MPLASELTPVIRQSLTDEVLERLLGFLAAGDQPTQRLPPEHELCDQLGVGRSALREALASLNHLGIVETRGKTRFGSTVAARSHMLRRLAQTGAPREVVRHALEARILLEPSMARLAATRATPDALATMHRFIQLMDDEGQGNPDLALAYDANFHVEIARATANPTLLHVVSAIADAMTATRRLSLHAPYGTDTSIAGHRAIFAAISGREPEHAEAAMREHLADVARLINLVSSDDRDGSDGSGL